ncbi:MAG TPA: hypothetical protein VGE67_03080 [Haloferula sp.]
MTFHPLYRWKSFWLGVLALGFLGWAWVRSMSNLDTWEAAKATRAFAVSNNASWVVLVFRETTPLDVPGISHLSTRIEGDSWFPIAAEVESDDATMRAARVAHWLLILLFLLPWTAFLAWRWRRMRTAR